MKNLCFNRFWIRPVTIFTVYTCNYTFYMRMFICPCLEFAHIQLGEISYIKTRENKTCSTVLKSLKMDERHSWCWGLKIVYFAYTFCASVNICWKTITIFRSPENFSKQMIDDSSSVKQRILWSTFVRLRLSCVNNLCFLLRVVWGAGPNGVN